MNRSKEIIRTSVIGIIANVLLASFKAIVGLLAHSVAVVLDAVRADEIAWANYLSFPETYRRIRVDFIQGYRHSGREEEAQKALRKFVQYCRDGKMLPGWDDFGRLK